MKTKNIKILLGLVSIVLAISGGIIMSDFCKECKSWKGQCIKGLKPYISKISKCEVCGWREEESVWEEMRKKHTDGKRY